MSGEHSSGGDVDAGAVSDDAVDEMVRTLRPSWRTVSIERADHGTDFVAFLAVRSPSGERSVVLKATTAAWASPETTSAEPRLLSLVGRETPIPVPEVFGYCDEHDTLPAPFYLMSCESGVTFEGRPHDLSPEARERIFRDAGRNLAALHELDTFSRVGSVGVRDGELAVLDGEDGERWESFHDWLLASYEDTLDSLETGGYFPDLADDPTRFADLVPRLRRYLRETVPALPPSEPPTYCHKDYRYGNLLVDPETGDTQAVIDWGLVMAAPPAFNLASAESLLLTPAADGPERTTELQTVLRSTYAETRDDWTFDEDILERMRTYRLACRLDAMACLPLWYPDLAEREERAAAHREFVAQYV